MCSRARSDVAGGGCAGGDLTGVIYQIRPRVEGEG